jgi:transaldolase / glucose-6-phosphate isomerase
MEKIMNPIQKVTQLGQSLWYDNIQRKLLDSGELRAMIERGDIRGVTSNPSIFNAAIAKSTDYDAALQSLAWAGWDSEKIFWQLAIEDIRSACEAFQPLYEETNGGDGYVSLEVSPDIANDTEKSLAQAEQLWVRVAQPNLMVKIPATPQGIPAIRKAIAAGLNINITLIFSLARYAEVMEAYLSGLEDRVAAGHPIDHVASVASFFISRVDGKIDGKLPEDSSLRGKAAIANAKLAYEEFQKVFSTRRWENLKVKGARVQRPLWASTSTKNPAYPDTYYIDTLIGPETVNTVPPQTLVAFKDHGKAEITITRDVDQAREDLERLKAAGIDMDLVTQELEIEGVKAFAESFAQLLGTIEKRRLESIASLGSLADAISKRMAKLDEDSVQNRLWAHDPTLWTTDPEGQNEVKKRMGWLDSPIKARELVPSYKAFADEIHSEGIHRILVLGMGGSSLTAEVFSSLQAAAKIDAPVSLAILDSTDPEQVSLASGDFPPDKSLYIVASKSGGTAEVMAAFDYFWKLSKGDGSRFVVITDPGTSLEALAREHNFRKIFFSDKEVGGRFSARTDFGLVPASLLGLDLNRLIGRAEWMRAQSYAAPGGLDGVKPESVEEQKVQGRSVPAARNPGLALGAAIGEAALQGRDKLTVVADKPLSAFTGWIEQIVAESSGKNGKGILPVPLEPLGDPAVYGNDRFFIYLKQTGELDQAMDLLRQAGHPVLEFIIPDLYDVAAEMYRWEVGVAIACSVIGVNAFDQPNVEISKKITKARIAEYQKSGTLEEGKPVWEGDFFRVFSPAPVKGNNLAEILNAFLAQAQPHGYVAINAYLPRNEEMIKILQQMRVAIRAKAGSAVTAGFGPRFQHSTGQFHKGGPNNGLFLVITSDSVADFEIPTQGLTFGTLIQAQALGDYEALVEAGRKVLRIHLSDPRDLEQLSQLIS